MTLFRGCRCLQDEAEVVSRREVPGTILLHYEGEILGVVICIVGEDVEHHPEEELVQFILGDGELPAGGEEILVAICLRIDSGKCLGEHLLTGTAVKPLCQEMADTFHLDQAGIVIPARVARSYQVFSISERQNSGVLNLRM